MRRTLASEFTVEGAGIHTGVLSHLEVKPSGEEKGIFFSYTDHKTRSPGYIPCHTANVVSTLRCTVLGNGTRTVSTVEHLLAALSANGITDAEIYIDGPEVPIMDGSARYFQGEIEKAGTETYEGDGAAVLEIEEELTYLCPDSGAEYTISPADCYTLEAILKYEGSILDGMSAEWRAGDDFSSQIAHTRTFSLYSEVESLLKAGLIKGGNLENALVIVDRDVSPEVIKSQIKQYITDAPDVPVTNGVINGPMYFDNEPARHKILDMLGDLSLMNLQIKGRISAVRPGHTGNSNLARHLIKLFYG